MSGRLHVVSKPEKQFLDDAVFAAERAKGKSCPVRKKKRCCAWPVISCWDSARQRPQKRPVRTRDRPLSSPGVSLSLFAVNPQRSPQSSSGAARGTEEASFHPFCARGTFTPERFCDQTP